jgi:putative addiction module component (TIGR02574 family)
MIRAKVRREGILIKMEIGKILPKLLKLPSEQRAELATQLIRSLDESEDSDAAQAWSREVSKRANDVKSGRVKTVSWAKARKRLEAKLRARHN